MRIKSDLPGKKMNVILFKPEKPCLVIQRIIAHDPPQHQKSTNTKQQVNAKSFEYGKYDSQKKRFRRWLLNDIENMPILMKMNL
jgi:hypothetical protein